MKPLKPAYADASMTLFRADCLRVLPQLESVGHCIGDFPYEETMHAAKRSHYLERSGSKYRNNRESFRKMRLDGGPQLKPVNFASIGDLRANLLPLLKGRCRGWFLGFCTPEGIAAWRDEIERAGLRYKRACFWTKPDAAPQFNGQGPGYAVEPFVTAWCGRGVSKWQAGGRRNFWEHPTNNADREGTEPTEKPIGLMMRLIEDFTAPGDLILDPVMGSGTTVIAAIATGRRAIGIERDPGQFKLARARIEAAFTMGRDEGRRHIEMRLGRVATPDDLPLFGG